MRAHGLAHRNGVDEEGPQRRRMQTPHVVDLKESIDDELPIGGASDGVLTIETMARESERIEVAVQLAKISRNIRRPIRGWVKHRPDQTMPDR
jgi:hypothetical protein